MKRTILLGICISLLLVGCNSYAEEKQSIEYKETIDYKIYLDSINKYNDLVREYNKFVKDDYSPYVWKGCKDQSNYFILDKYNMGCTGSMRPTFSCNNKVYLCYPNENEIYLGDIISFTVGNLSIIHRVIDFKDGKYITKGDNNHVKDPHLVEFKNVDGKVFRIEG